MDETTGEGDTSPAKTRRFERIGRWYKKYERYLIPGVLLLGMVSDALLFRSVDLNWSFLILTGHLVVAGATMIFLRSAEVGVLAWRVFRYLRLFAPLVLQYTFGALLSGFLIFYWFSGSLGASWPFILLIVLLMVANEIGKEYYLRLKIQVGVYFFIVFSYSVLVLPFLIRTIEPWVFVVGGLLSLVLIWVYLALLARVRSVEPEARRALAWIIGVIFLLMNLFYFTNLIPPVPLSLREAGVYYEVARELGGYRVVAPDRPWWQISLRPKLLVAPGQPVYFYASVFSPTRLNTEIVHHWQHYDERAGRWITRSRVSYGLVGGRDGGYRGFSLTNQPTAGRWRVSVETRRGQVIGRLAFRLIPATSQIATEVLWR